MNAGPPIAQLRALWGGEFLYQERKQPVIPIVLVVEYHLANRGKFFVDLLSCH